MTDVRDKSKRPTPLPWSLVTAALVAFLALRYTSEHTAMLVVFGMLLVVQRVAGLSLPPQLGGGRALRVGVFAFIAMVIGLPNEGVRQWYLNPEYTNLIGHVLAAEIVIQALGTTRKRPKVVLIYSAFVLAMASNTLDRQYIQLFTPIFFVLAMVSLRSLMPTGAGRGRFVAMRAAAGVLAVVLGFVMIDVLVRMERELQILAMNFVRRNARTSDIGLSMTPQLDGSFNLEPSMERVLLIEGPRAERHWRVISFDVFDQNRWGPSLRLRDFRYLAQEQSPLIEGHTRLEVRILGDTFDVLPMPLNAGGLESLADLDRENGGAVRFHDARVDQLYVVGVHPDEKHQGMISNPPDDPTKRRLLEFPVAVDSKVKDLAIGVAGEGDAPIRLARLAQHLRASHQYSLSFSPGSGDPLSDFILNKRAAHCEFFASAMVIMSRSIGVPARLVTGYYAHESAGEDRMVVRDRDAHAWAECWIDGVGWITMDATPPAGLPDALFEPPSRLRRMWETVVDFPSLLQKWLSFLSREMILWVVFLIAGTVIGIGVFQLIRRKPMGGPAPYALPDGRLVVISRRFEAWLKEHGHTCATNRTWREQVQTTDGRRFIDLYDEARFGGANGQTIERLDQMMQTLESSVPLSPVRGGEVG